MSAVPEFDTLRDQLAQGVQVVSVPQLFPTPADLADRMVDQADIETGHTVLEPSAGTGALLHAIRRAGKAVVATAVEINLDLVNRLALDFDDVRLADFLQWKGDARAYDRIVMNPPFADGQDIQHIQHALTLLKPGGRLVALCADGPRQRAVLRPLVDARGGDWEVLPPGVFLASGRGVHVVMLTIDNRAS